MKKFLSVIILVLLCIGISGCNKFASSKEEVGSAEVTEDKTIVIGFSQLGAESDWRSANTESMKSTFSKENGYTLIFEDGQQKQANQITAI